MLLIETRYKVIFYVLNLKDYSQYGYFNYSLQIPYLPISPGFLLNSTSINYKQCSDACWSMGNPLSVVQNFYCFCGNQSDTNFQKQQLNLLNVYSPNSCVPCQTYTNTCMLVYIQEVII